MFATRIRRFTQRLLASAFVVAAAGGLGGMVLVAYFADDLVAYFVSTSGSIVTWQPKIEPVPFDTQFGTLGNPEFAQ